MTRDEALRRLHGSWSFTVRDDRVLLRDVDLIAAVRNTSEPHEPPPAGPPHRHGGRRPTEPAIG